MSLLVDGKIAIVYLVCRKAFQITLVVIFKERKVLIEETGVFLFKYLPKKTFYDLALFIIALIVGYFVDKEERKCLDTLLE